MKAAVWVLGLYALGTVIVTAAAFAVVEYLDGRADLGFYMYDWDILTVLVLPVILCTLMLGVAVGVAWDEYRHRH